jgi:hypothetical protein
MDFVGAKMDFVGWFLVEVKTFEFSVVDGHVRFVWEVSCGCLFVVWVFYLGV